MNNNIFTDKSLSIIFFDANGLKNHVNELQITLYNKRVKIALITKTHFTQYSHINIPRYKLIKTNHPDNTAHGGVAIFIKTTLVFQVLPSFCQDFLRSYAVLTKLNNIPVLIAAIYSPPRHNITNADFLNDFSTFSNNFMIDGDYNSKHQR